MRKHVAITAWLTAVLIALSWLVMMAVHEVGHVLHAWLSDATVVAVDLHPLHFSHTAVHPNPHPHFVVWGGPVWGVVVPVIVWGAARLWWRRYDFLLRFLAGFCLLTNGVYLGLGWFDDIGDPGDLRRLGTPVAVMIIYGLVCAVLGLLCWNGVGARLGIGKKAARPDARVAAWLTVALVVVAGSAWLTAPQ